MWICTENWIKHMDDPVCFSFCIVVKNAEILWSVYFSKFKDMGINFKWQNWFDCSWGSLLLFLFPILNKSYWKILKLSIVNYVYCGFNVFVLYMCQHAQLALILLTGMTEWHLACLVSPLSIHCLSCFLAVFC